MKAEFDKEIDSLLRERARRGRGAPVAQGARTGGASPSAHLDADEQSAYAENALPAIARAHYTAHLADCDDCRRGVTQLALAAGMPAQLEQRETATVQASATRIGWRERLGALLAPRAWRYAVPALALLLVSAIALIVLTQRPRRDAAGETSIARRNSSNAQRPQIEQSETHHAPQNGNVATNGAATSDNGSAAVSPDSKASPAREEIAANSPPVETAQPVVGAGAGNAAPAPPAPASGSGAVARPASEVSPPAPTPLQEALTVTADQQAMSKSSARAAEPAKSERNPGGFVNRQSEDRRDQSSGPRRSEQARNTRDAEADDSQGRADKKDEDVAATTAPAQPTAAARRTRQRDADSSSRDMNRQAEASEMTGGGRTGAVAETRTVAGRKFRRQGSAWIDTAYNAGQSYTLVRRNSEQFRALVADEPELRRIAGALGGEVTVVWKGRAYRIR